MKVDASGCKKPDATSTLILQSSPPNTSGNEISSPPKDSMLDNNKAETNSVDNGDDQSAKGSELETSSFQYAKAGSSLDVTASTAVPNVDELSRSKGSNLKRHLAQEDVTRATKTAESDAYDLPACQPQGLASPPESSHEEFTIGGQADSVYEYLPKEYMLLGGLEDVYRRMYEMAVETTKKYLLFRPMVPEDRNLLLSGVLRTSGHLDDPDDLSLNPEGTHLTCFAGGMFAIGAKIFNREDDMDIARKLTEGCIWAYEVTATGIMPERYLAAPCQNQDQCHWNETLYRQMLDALTDPGEGHSRSSQQTVLDTKDSNRNQAVVTESDQIQDAEVPEQSTKTFDAEDVEPDATGASMTKETRVNKRQLADAGDEKPMQLGNNAAEAEADEISSRPGQHSQGQGSSEDRPEESYTPPPTPTLKKSSESRISDGKVPVGMTKVISSAYILRYVVSTFAVLLWILTS